MKIVIVGDGKVGATLVEHLSTEGHDVVVIDRDQKIVEQMVNSYDVMGICGNGANCELQLEAGVDSSDLFVAATSSDELNILSCLMAKKAGAVDSITLTGGCAKNDGLKKAIEKVLKINVVELKTDPQLMGALGAAEYARQKGLAKEN